MSSRVLEVATEPSYPVHVGPGVLGKVESLLRPDERTLLITDTHVAPLYAEELGGRSNPRLVVEAGEACKSFDTLESVLDRLAEADLDRGSCVLALGGGTVGDLGGLAASLYMRGIEFVQLPTTLLAQVDASVGGKTAVNLRAGKNLAGTFHQPRAVLADTDTLGTLSDEEYRSGLGEVLKTALLEERGLDWMEAEAAGLLARDPVRMTEVVTRCVRRKSEIVARDERESGERKKLNLGHTFAHALEHVAGYGRIPHGVAVGTGLVLALSLSARLGVLREGELVERVTRLLAELDMPSTLPELRSRYGCALEKEALWSAMAHDKKGRAGEPVFVLLSGQGKAVLDARVERPRILELLD